MRSVVLIIGHTFDTTCHLVANTLRYRGCDVVQTSEPLANTTTFSWELDGATSKARLTVDAQQVALDAEGLTGVVVRPLPQSQAPDKWRPEDFTYVETETRAALVAWLWSLPCTVINRLSADLWFRPYRSLIDWSGHWKRCNLPTLSAQITNDVAEARAFAERWNGAATYAPLTSVSRYPLTDAKQWSELENVTARLPVCVIQPVDPIDQRACLVGDDVIWRSRPDVSLSERAQLEAGIRQLASLLGLCTLELEFGATPAGLAVTGMDLFPIIDWYSQRDQQLIADRIADRLTIATSQAQLSRVGGHR